MAPPAPARVALARVAEEAPVHTVIGGPKRRPGLTVEAFQKRWLNRHGPLRAAIPGLRRHVRSRALAKGSARGERPFDGICACVFDNPQAWEAARACDAFRAAEADAATFAGTVVMEVDVHVIRHGPIPDGVSRPSRS